MKTPKQQFNSCAGGTIIHLRGREQALELVGLTVSRAKWITLACLEDGVFTRAQRARFTDAHPRTGAARRACSGRAGPGRGDRARHPRDRTGLSDLCPKPLPDAGTGSGRARMRALGWHGVRGRPKPGSSGRVSTSKRPMRRVEPERPQLPCPGLSAAAKAGEPAYPPWPHSVRPRQGLAGGRAPCDPHNRNGAS